MEAYGGPQRAGSPPQLSYLEELQELRALREAINQGNQPLPPIHKHKNQALAGVALPTVQTG